MSVDFFFAWPAMLLILPLPWLALRLLPPPPPVVMLKLPSLAGLAGMPSPAASGLSWLGWLAWGLLVIAAARPQLPEPAPLPVSGRSLMLAFDLSASMATRDMSHEGQAVERIDAALMLARAFLARREGDRVGLIVFGKQAYLHVPPTLDLQAVTDALAGVRVGLAGRETALGDAMALATQQLRSQPDAARVLVLLTDGAHTAGRLTPQRAAWLAQREGVRIHAVGLGGKSSNNAAFDLDEPTLQAVTGQTGGHYARATDSKTLGEFFSALERIEPIPDHDPNRRPARELYPWPLLAALGLMAWLARSRPAGSTGISYGHVDYLSQVVDAHLLAHVRVTHRERGPALRLFWLLAVLLVVLLWLPIGKPTASYQATPLRVLLADLSRADQDAVVRSHLATLLAAMPAGDTALVVYAGDAYLAVPPTRDANNILALVPELAADIMPVSGRHPERAEALAQALLARHAGRPAQVIRVDADTPIEKSLALLARPQGQHWAGLSAGLGVSRGDWRDGWPLLLLTLLPLALIELRRSGVPAAVLLASTFLTTLMLVPTRAEAVENEWAWQAVAHYRAGRYPEVLQILAGRQDADAHYNRGNALARLGHFAEAEMAYSASLAQRPDEPDALFNRALMRKLQSPPPQSPPAGKGAASPPDSPSPAHSEASRIAEQWLRGVPNEPAGLLRAKLRLEQERRQREGR